MGLGLRPGCEQEVTNDIKFTTDLQPIAPFCLAVGGD